MITTLLARWLAHPLTAGLSEDDPRLTLLRREIIRQKPFLRQIYTEWYRLLADALPPGSGPILEIGSGAGFIEQCLPGAITSEVRHFPGIRLVLNAQDIPFDNQALRAIVMTDVFHHIPLPAAFLKEASRTVRKGGIVAMIEPWKTEWAEFIYDKFHSEPFKPDVLEWKLPAGAADTDGPLLRTVLDAVRLGAENLRLQADLLARLAELHQSRARIVEAGMAERRRVERDLHDGAQQKLLAVAATLARADMIDDGQVREVVADARDRLTSALRELRELARGIHPAALSQGGLPAALPALCVGAPWPVKLRVEPDLATRRPPPGPEAAVYFLIAEALANAARHAHAQHVSVDVRRDRDALHVRLSDDGIGGALLVPGGGLDGLNDRVDAFGGQLTICNGTSSAQSDAHGTVLVAMIPTREAHE